MGEKTSEQVRSLMKSVLWGVIAALFTWDVFLREDAIADPVAREVTAWSEVGEFYQREGLMYRYVEDCSESQNEFLASQGSGGCLELVPAAGDWVTAMVHDRLSDAAK